MKKDWQKIENYLTQFPYYTKQNLSLIFNKKDYAYDYWIKKLIKEEILIPLKKGFYITSYYLNQVKKEGLLLNYFKQLANILRQPSYISLETALSYYNLIPESTFNITSITLKSTRVYKNTLAIFIYRNIKRELFFGFNLIDNFQIASKAKALFDYLYLKKFNDINQTEYFLKQESRINWLELTKNDFKEFNQYVNLSKSIKMKKISKIISLLIDNG